MSEEQQITPEEQQHFTNEYIQQQKKAYAELYDRAMLAETKLTVVQAVLGNCQKEIERLNEVIRNADVEEEEEDE